jgi:cystathionine beta-lyase
MEWSLDDAGVGTVLAHFGESEKIKGAVIPPIFQNSLFVFDRCEALFESMIENPTSEPYHYSRMGNPTVDLAAKKIANLEGGEACVLAGTGMGAVSMAVMSCLDKGSHVVMVDSAYPPTRILVNDYMTSFGVTHSVVSGICPEEVIDAIQPDTSLVILESPSSFVFRLQDFETITKACRQKGVKTMTDNTYATPLYQKPLAMGVDLVVHSGTKYFGGHSDITAGAVVASQEHIDRMSRRELALFGSILAPFPAWLLNRGLRTLEIRLKRHEETANLVAGWLEDHSEVEMVNHVGLPSHPQRELFRKQMQGSTGLFSFVPNFQDQASVYRFCEALRVFSIGISWGGFESLVVPLLVQPAGFTEPTYVIRLFCGLEDPKDLVADLQQAFQALS